MKILYICTHNRCRSIMSEAITNKLADGVISAKSAGSEPEGEVHPLSLKYLKQRRYGIEGLQSQSWHEFENLCPDLVITLCDSAVGESCPLYFSKSIKMHWGLPDPSKVSGSDYEKEMAFLNCITEIEGRVEQLIALANAEQDKETMVNRLKALGAK